MFREYWNAERETADPSVRRAVILERLKVQLARAERLPLYQEIWGRHGFEPGMVESIDDFRRLVPVVRKEDLRADQAKHPPFGSYLGVAHDEIKRIQSSSGTTGQATVYAVSREDWERAKDISGYGMWTAGVRPGDIVHSAFPFGLFFGGWGVYEGVEAIGAVLVPAGGHTSTARQAQLMARVGPQVYVSTPSYALHMGQELQRQGLRIDSIRTLLCGGEAGASVPSVRSKLRKLWGSEINIIDLGAGTTSEVFPFMGNISCTAMEGGVHVTQDEVYYEIAAKDDPFAPASDGESGAVVATPLWRESMPMIRFWTGDEATMSHEPCPCGRTYPTLPRGVFGRLDDMLVIRGVNVYPSAIEDVLRKDPGVGQEFRIELRRNGSLDSATIKCEHIAAADSPAVVQEARDQLARELKNWLGISVDVEIEFPGTLEAQTFKARRVADLR